MHIRHLAISYLSLVTKIILKKGMKFDIDIKFKSAGQICLELFC